jgi:hypothetical protein
MLSSHNGNVTGLTCQIRVLLAGMLPLILCPGGYAGASVQGVAGNAVPTVFAPPPVVPFE